MKRPTSIRLSFSLSVILAIVAFVLINLAGAFLLNGRVDLTENKIYTLSEGTYNVIEQLKEPIQMRLYYSDSLAQEGGSIHPYATRVRSLLDQYAAISDGKLLVEFVDPEPFSAEEDQASAFGLQPAPTNNNRQFYFGLVVSDSVDTTKVIPFFNPQRETFLEYDITKLIYELNQTRRAVVGVLSWLPENLMSGNDRLIFLKQIEEQYTVTTIDTTAEKLPATLDSLLVMHPQPDINEKLAYAIDQYLLNDGKVVVFVDPLNEEQRDGKIPGSSDMSKLFAAWGVEYKKDQVVGDLDSALRVNIQSANGVRAMNHPTWLQFGSIAFNKTNPITAQLNQARFISAGGLALDVSIDAIEFTPLVEASNRSGQISRALMQTPDPNVWIRSLNISENPQVLAARYSGTFTTAYGDKSTEPNHLSKSVQQSNLIVIADVDMLFDKYWVETQNFLGQQLVIRTADNGTMILNAVDNMVGSSDLISLRSRGVKDRKFEVVSRLRQTAESQFREQEETLQQELRTTEARINQLQQNKQSKDALILNDAQQREIQKFRQKRVDTRKQLRDLQLRLNREIENLGSWLKFLNIMIIPLLLLLASFFMPTWLGVRKN